MVYMIELATECGDSKLLGYTGGTLGEARQYAKKELPGWVRSLYQDGTPVAAGYEINRPGESRPLAEKWFCIDVGPAQGAKRRRHADTARKSEAGTALEPSASTPLQRALTALLQDRKYAQGPDEGGTPSATILYAELDRTVALQNALRDAQEALYERQRKLVDQCIVLGE